MSKTLIIVCSVLTILIIFLLSFAFVLDILSTKLTSVIDIEYFAFSTSGTSERTTTGANITINNAHIVTEYRLIDIIAFLLGD